MSSLKKPVFRDAVILIMASLLLSVPFINQSFHLDDRDFIEFAQASAEDPLKFRIEGYSSMGRLLPAQRDPHPPLLTTYLSVPLRLGTGVSETVFHSLYLVFPVIASLSMYSLARRFTKRPLASALLLMFTAGCLVLSHTIMGNFPGLALWLAAAALFIKGVDLKNPWLLAGSSIVMTLAIMTAHQAMSIIPVMFCYAIINRRFRLWNFVALTFPLGVYLVWRYYIQTRYGHPPAISYRTGGLSYDKILIAMIIFVGGSNVFPLSMLLLNFRNRARAIIGLLVVLPLSGLVAVDYVRQGEASEVQGVMLALMAAAGITALCLFAFKAGGAVSLLRSRDGERADSLFISLWFFIGVASYLAFVVSYVSVRHLLLLFPPLILLFMREAESLWPSRPVLKRVFVPLTLVLTLTLGLSASIADYRLANAYRDVAIQMGDRYGDSETGIWERGDFGFQYYMNQQGFAYLSNKSEIRPGDMIVTANLPGSVMVTPWPEGNYSLEDKIEIKDSFPFRIMNPWANAGFYGHPMGPLPIALSTERLEEITVYRYLGPAS